jgi:UDP-N-acetylglucosamine 2-epimerase
VGYFDMLLLMRDCRLVMTDSGGMQKEAYWLKVPCVKLRDETEWIEIVEAGWNILYTRYRGWHRPKTERTDLYGDGRSAVRILDILLEGILPERRKSRKAAGNREGARKCCATDRGRGGESCERQGGWKEGT